MKFRVTFENRCGTTLRGLRLLDTIRQYIHNVPAEEVADHEYLGSGQTVVLTEELARRSGKFVDDLDRVIYVNARDTDWRDLYKVVGTKLVTSSDGNKVAPVIEFDPQPLLEAWEAQGFPTSTRIKYPYTKDE